MPPHFRARARRRALSAYAAFFTTFGLATSVTPALANPAPSVTELISAVSDAQSEVDRLDLAIGSLREEVNRALVDLRDAQGAAEQARQGAQRARKELDESQRDLQLAQGDVDDIARSVYRSAGSSSVAPLAAGADSQRDSLDRQTYLRQQSEDRVDTLETLDLNRTQKANSESRLRLAQQLAEAREKHAEEAELEAQRSLDANSAELERVSAERDRLARERDDAQAELHGNRLVDSPEAPEAPPTPEPAESDEDVVPGEETAADVAAQQPEHATLDNPYPQVPDAPAVEIAPRQAPLERASATEVSPTPDDAGHRPVVSDSVGGGEATDINQNTRTVAEDVDTSSQGSSALATELVTLLTEMAEAETQPVEDDVVIQVVDHQATELEEVLPEVDAAEDVSTTVADVAREAQIETVIARAQSQLGTPYAWGGGDANGPTRGIRDGGTADAHGDYNKVGFDCSGLTLYAFAGAGISLPHYTGYQYQRGEKINPAEMQRGDLIFYGPTGNHHVAIYLGNGMMIEAPQSGGYVQETPVRWSGMSDYAVRLI